MTANQMSERRVPRYADDGPRYEDGAYSEYPRMSDEVMSDAADAFEREPRERAIDAASERGWQWSKGEPGEALDGYTMWIARHFDVEAGGSCSLVLGFIKRDGGLVFDHLINFGKADTTEADLLNAAEAILHRPPEFLAHRSAEAFRGREAPGPDAVARTLAARGNERGKFEETARLTQELMIVMQGSANWEGLPYAMREALHMQAVKTARILNGDPCHPDHWHDIAGYATLVEELIFDLGLTR